MKFFSKKTNKYVYIINVKVKSIMLHISCKIELLQRTIIIKFITAIQHLHFSVNDANFGDLKLTEIIY